MKEYLLLVLGAAGAACGSHGVHRDEVVPEAATPTEAQPAVPATPEKLGVVFERLVVGWDEGAPLFGPDGSITVGERRWGADGAVLARHAFARGGQLRPVAIAGSAAAPRVVALGWSGLENVPEAPAADDRAWLVTAELRADAWTSATPIHHEFLGPNTIVLSPDGASLLAIERGDLVVHATADGAERARVPLGEVAPVEFPEAQLACWLDAAHVAWIGRAAGGAELRVAALSAAPGRATGRAASTPIARTPLAKPATLVACDPQGGAAAIAIPGAVAVLDLATARIGAAQAVADDVERTVAIGARGQRLAIATERAFTLYRRDGEALTAAFALTKPPFPPPPEGVEYMTRLPQLAFSRDGARLAVVDGTLLVIGDVTDQPPAPPVPTFAFDLPRGFVAVPLHQRDRGPWMYSQLPEPSGAAPLPALLVSARATHPRAEVTGLALDLAELPPVPPDTASDAEMTAFALATMGRWFEEWRHATVGDPEDDTYTVKLGRTNGMRWFETREVHRDGCEPYDGYTRVVLDTRLTYVVRAITVPGGAIDGWLATFLDLPFGARVQTARRRGPRAGPC